MGVCGEKWDYDYNCGQRPLFVITFEQYDIFQ